MNTLLSWARYASIVRAAQPNSDASLVTLSSSAERAARSRSRRFGGTLDHVEHACRTGATALTDDTVSRSMTVLQSSSSG